MYDLFGVMQEKGNTKILKTHNSLVYLSEHTKVFCSYINVYVLVGWGGDVVSSTAVKGFLLLSRQLLSLHSPQ